MTGLRRKKESGKSVIYEGGAESDASHAGVQTNPLLNFRTIFHGKIITRFVATFDSLSFLRLERVDSGIYAFSASFSEFIHLSRLACFSDLYNVRLRVDTFEVNPMKFSKSYFITFN